MIKEGFIFTQQVLKRQGKTAALVRMQSMAFIVEQAGGKASDGFGRIMELKPTELHERVPFFCGSFNMVERRKNLCMT
jgi:fructose-1,6-bisphosphatase I